ncbi:MAG TPA: hypothetical protein VJS20_00150, partial [Gemmatimonadales bacterium]|nr:hypothetical protein [Gemmatimonadales bacterium]
TGSGLNCVQGGKQQVAAGAGLMPADGQVTVAARHALSTVPSGRRRAQNTVDGGALCCSRRGIPEMKIH